MVTVRLSLGSEDASKLALADWIADQARVPDVAIGEITMGDSESTVEIHVRKASYVIDVLKSRSFQGRKLKPAIVN
jgi:hypothetical protein